ncbi:hypothetical protein Trydic_g7525 [Trypoxylus dichotomus]
MGHVVSPLPPRTKRKPSPEPRATMQPCLRERGCEPDRAYPSASRRSPHGRGRRRADTTHVTGRGESHREVIPAQQGPGTGRHHLPRSQARPPEIRHP